MLSASTLEDWLGDVNVTEPAHRRAAALACDRSPRGEALHGVTLFSTSEPRPDAHDAQIVHPSSELIASDNVETSFASRNDYLGLSSHPRVRRAMSQACEDWGGGPRSSALVAGHTAQQRDLAGALAKLKSKEACVLFPSG